MENNSTFSFLTERDFFNYFRQIPISINNLYGDPFFPSQMENTFQKLDHLKESGHQGIVSIITKSEVSEDTILLLKEYLPFLKLIILVSVSNLPFSIEQIKGNRIRTLFLCQKHKIPCLAYIRPFIPGENTSEEKIEEMFVSIKEAGVSTCVVSGLRGNDEILSSLKLSEKSLANWSLRVKTMPKDVKKAIFQFKEKYQMTVFDRTSCGVSYVLKLGKSYNPYYSSPKLAGCFSCPIKKTCFDQQNHFLVTEKDLETVNALGYSAQKVNEGSFELCEVEPENRTGCISCCTSCFKLEREAIEIKPFENICLGDIGLLRLLTGKLVFCKDLIDNGDSSIARPKNPFLKNENIYILNSWWSYSRNTSSCYGCSYCIVPHFKNQNREYGEVPLIVAEKIASQFKEEGGVFLE